MCPLCCWSKANCVFKKWGLDAVPTDYLSLEVIEFLTNAVSYWFCVFFKLMELISEEYLSVFPLAALSCFSRSSSSYAFFKNTLASELLLICCIVWSASGILPEVSLL